MHNHDTMTSLVEYEETFGMFLAQVANFNILLQASFCQKLWSKMPIKKNTQDEALER